MIQSNQYARRGSATILALISLTLVGVTIGGLMTRISDESRRTEAEAKLAQLRQLGIATAAAAPDGIRLPTNLFQDGYDLQKLPDTAETNYSRHNERSQPAKPLIP
jgi:type II secretory pathway pseudopilin PulG